MKTSRQTTCLILSGCLLIKQGICFFCLCYAIAWLLWDGIRVNQDFMHQFVWKETDLNPRPAKADFLPSKQVRNCNFGRRNIVSVGGQKSQINIALHEEWHKFLLSFCLFWKAIVKYNLASINYLHQSCPTRDL